MKTACSIFAATLMLLTAGCLFRYEEPFFIGADTGKPEVKAMSAAKAKEIIDEALSNPPAGRRPQNPGWLKLGRRATSVRLKLHNRTGLVLVEVMDGEFMMMDFYVRSMEDGREFANALWRAKLEAKAPAAAPAKAAAPAR